MAELKAADEKAKILHLPTSQDPTNKVMTPAEVKEHLATALDDGISQSDLEVMRLNLAADSDLSPPALLQLQRTIEAEHQAKLGIAAEIITLRAEQDRQEIGQSLTLDYLFPPSLAEALRVRCRALPADAPSAAMSYLAAVAGLVKLGSEVIASKAADFRVPLNLYTALVGKSGAKKSPQRRLLVDAPAQPLMLDLARTHSRAMEQWQEENRGLKPAEQSDPPRAAYLQVSDFTIEALAEQLQRQEAKGLGLLINRDELSGLFGSLNAYKGGRGADEQHLLEAYDGGAFRSLRVASPGGGRFYDRCSLSIYGTIQPAVLEKLVVSGDDSGLWARFMFVALPAKVVPLPEVETEIEQQEAAAAAAALADACGVIYRMPRTSLALDPAARRAFTRYEANCQHEALRAAIPAHSALWGKSAGKVLRIAGLLHLLHLAVPDGAAGEVITSETMERATTLVDYINGWTLGLHSDLAQGGTSSLMRLVHKIAVEAQQPIRWRDVQNRLSVKQRNEIDSAKVVMAMQALADLEVGEIEHGARGAEAYRAKAELP
jgi:CRISPR-associated protein Cmr3